MAIDWKQIWSGTHNFAARYSLSELRTPPWALIFIWPLTLLDLKLSWALAAYLSFALLVVSIPRKTTTKRRVLATLLLATSYPALRQLIDGNLEALIIGGTLLLLYSLPRRHAWGFTISLLLLSAKIQETWLLLPFAIYQQWSSWPTEQRWRPYAYAAAIAVLPLLKYGSGWLEAMFTFPWPGTLIDASLRATMQRLALAAPLYWLAWIAGWALLIQLLRSGKLRANQASYALLISAALLLGPYAASNSALTPLALGVIPLVLKRPSWSLALAALYYFPYFMLGNTAWRYAQESNYWTLVLVLTFFALLADHWDSAHNFSGSPASQARSN